jgi:predicted Zn-dependent peptidase
MQIREKHGIAYTIESNYTPYSDTGIFSVYFGTDAEKAERATKLVYKELRKLREDKLGVLQLHQAKQKFIGQIALAEENRLGVILGMSKNLMEQGHIDSLPEVFARIQVVTARQLQEIANEIFDEGSLSMLSFIPAGG